MTELLKPFMFAAALTGGALSVYASGIDLAGLNASLTRFSATSVAFINKTLTPARPEAAPLDPVAAANVNEDLDYRIAAQTKSVQGWRSFLAAHPNGAHASAAHAELDKLQPPPQPAPGLDKLQPRPPPAPAVAKLNTPSEQPESVGPTEGQSAEAPESQTKPADIEVPKPATTTIVKSRERRAVRRRVARPRRRTQPSSLPPFLAALFGDLRGRGGGR